MNGQLRGIEEMTLMVHKIRRARAGEKLYSLEQPPRSREREHARAERSGQEFSFIVFEMSESSVAADAIQQFARVLPTRLRFTDEVRWLGRRQIGVVLPGMAADGARKLIDNLCQTSAGLVALPPRMIIIYPSPAPRFFLENAQPLWLTAAAPGYADSKTEDPCRTCTDRAVSVAQVVPAGNPSGDQSAEGRAPMFIRHAPLWKRGMDIAGSLAGIFVAAPLMALMAIAIKLTSAGPIIFTQKRIGYGGKPFLIYKFRSMFTDVSETLHAQYIRDFMNGTAARNDEGAFKLKDDPRLTPLGRFLRKWSLDELPQFLNVLKGEMSLVGPRPDPWYAADHYAPWHHLRTILAKPGITGLWQVEGRSRVTHEEMIRMDIRYGQSLSFITDLKLMLRTAKAVFTHAGAY